MLKGIYYWLLKNTGQRDERGEPSCGYLQAQVRKCALRHLTAVYGYTLEVGCGEGLFLNNLIQKNPGVKVCGIDLSFSQLVSAMHRLDNGNNKVGLFQADAVCLPFKENSFKQVVCINVFMNIPDEAVVDRILEEISRVVDKDGRVIIEIRNKDNPLIRIKYKLARYYDGTIGPGMLKAYSLREMREKILSKGLRVNKILTVGFPKMKSAPAIVIEAIKK